MQLGLYQIDAFTSRLFGGNPAAVIPLQDWLDDELMQKIAAENNLPETAFFVGQDGKYELRWFAPLAEVDLCGHATLATAWVLYSRLNEKSNKLVFQTRSGDLTVVPDASGLTLDLPVINAVACEPPKELLQAIVVEPEDVLQAEDYIVVLRNEQQLKAIQPNFSLLKKIALRGVVVTAPGDEVDFVSRMFAPKFGIDEDPVTGSSHCSLTPYWAERLAKTRFIAHQLSDRGGEIKCELDADGVKLSGQCVEYMQATITIH